MTSWSAGVWSSMTLTSVAVRLPKRTWTGTLKPEPKMLTRVPPPSGPAIGEIEAISGVGSSAITRKAWVSTFEAPTGLSTLKSANSLCSRATAEKRGVLISIWRPSGDADRISAASGLPRKVKVALVAMSRLRPNTVTWSPPRRWPNAGSRP